MSGRQAPDPKEVIVTYERFVALARETGLGFVFPDDVYRDDVHLSDGPRSVQQWAAQAAVELLRPAKENAEAAILDQQSPGKWDGGKRTKALNSVNKARKELLNATRLFRERRDLCIAYLKHSTPSIRPEELADTKATDLCDRIVLELASLETGLTESHVVGAAPTKRDWTDAVSQASALLLEHGIPALQVAKAVYGRENESAVDALRRRASRWNAKAAADQRSEVK